MNSEKQQGERKEPYVPELIDLIAAAQEMRETLEHFKAKIYQPYFKRWDTIIKSAKARVSK